MKRCSVGALLVCLAVLQLSGCAARPDEPAMNVVVIVIDDMVWVDTSVCGSTFYEVPNIDRRAAAGARFTQF